MVTGGSDHRRPLADINVTPLVDVMMVLLVIFMVTAPMMQQGVDVRLPEARGKALPSTERIIVSVGADERIFINRTPVELRDLQRQIIQIVSSRENKDVFLKADKSVPYGLVAKIMGEIREAGIDKLGMVTEPLPR